MVRAPCCEKMGLKRGPWSPEEDHILISFIQKNGHGNWRALPKQAGLLRCGKSCRLRWTNYLRPDIKRGNFTKEEEDAIINLHQILGNRWSTIAARLPGRTDNEIKNIWHTNLKKRLKPSTSIPKCDTKVPENPDSSAPFVVVASPQQCSSGISTVTTHSSTEKTVVKNEEVDYSSEYLSQIDESFWSEEPSEDNVCRETKAAASTEKVNGDCRLRVSVEDDDSMDFWYNLFTRAGDMPDLPEF